MTPVERRDGVGRKGMKTARTERQKKIALVAHDSKKDELLEGPDATGKPSRSIPSTRRELPEVFWSGSSASG